MKSTIPARIAIIAGVLSSESTGFPEAFTGLFLDTVLIPKVHAKNSKPTLHMTAYIMASGPIRAFTIGYPINPTFGSIMESTCMSLLFSGSAYFFETSVAIK